MAKGLTKRQQAILQFVIQCIRDYGMPPTIAEIGAKFDINSTNGVNDHLVDCFRHDEVAVVRQFVAESKP